METSTAIQAREILSRGTLWTIHGLMLGATFFLVMPLGAIGIRQAPGDAFTYHWIIQTIAAGTAIVGMLLGFFLSHAVARIHQYVGLALLACVCVQPLFGFLHHKHFVEIGRRSKFSSPHIWLGRGVILAGGLNAVAGLLLRGRSTFIVSLALVVFLVIALGVGTYLWKLSLAKQKVWRSNYESQQLSDFSVELSEDEDEERASHDQLRDEHTLSK